MAGYGQAAHQTLLLLLYRLMSFKPGIGDVQIATYLIFLFFVGLCAV
jgi:hypothetical protein